jgi:hypothetical protein
MDVYRRLKELTASENHDHLITTLYLRFWPDARLHRTTLKDLLEEKNLGLKKDELHESEKRLVEKDLEKIEDYMGTLFEPSFRGIAIFSSTAAGLWEVFPINFPVRDLLVLDYMPHTRPLLKGLGEYRKACTALVDRAHARIFRIAAADIEEKKEMLSELPKPRDMGEYSLNERQVERHVGEHVRSHLNTVVERLLSLFERDGFDWLLLGGSPRSLLK